MSSGGAVFADVAALDVDHLRRQLLVGDAAEQVRLTDRRAPSQLIIRATSSPEKYGRSPTAAASSSSTISPAETTFARRRPGSPWMPRPEVLLVVHGHLRDHAHHKLNIG